MLRSPTLRSSGVSTLGAGLRDTTFPGHEAPGNIVAAGDQRPSLYRTVPQGRARALRRSIGGGSHRPDVGSGSSWKPFIGSALVALPSCSRGPRKAEGRRRLRRRVVYQANTCPASSRALTPINCACGKPKFGTVGIATWITEDGE